MDDMKVEEAVRKYTYEDYLNRDDDVRFELIDGVIHMLETPATINQQISGEIHAQLHDFLKGKPCKVFYAPFGVRLSVGKGSDTVLEPDLLVICDRSKLDNRGIGGAPDLVVEILSPSTSKKDKTIKFKKYLEAGVRELWIVEPADKTVTVNILRDGEYVARTYDDSEILPVHILEGCRINLQEVFAEW